MNKQIKVRYETRKVIELVAAAIVIMAFILPFQAVGQESGGSEGEAQQLTQLPELVEFVEAEYPASAQAQGIQGEVELNITVDETGTVTSVELAKPAGYGFDEAALSAARKFKFKPAMAGEQPVPVIITYRYKFVLAETHQKAPLEAKQEETKTEGAPETGVSTTAARLDMPVNLFGQVRERGTRTPLAQVEITIEGLEDFVATSDDNGNFEFHGVPFGYHVLKLALVGYEIGTVGITILEGQKTEATIYLEKLAYNEYSITIRGKKPAEVVTKHVLEQEEIKRLPGTQGDTIKVVEALPGVARTPMGLGGLLVFRGGDDGTSAVFVDRLIIPQIFHFGGVRSVINSDLIQDLEFYPGNFSAEYGYAIAGIIDVKTRKPKEDRFHGKTDINIYEGGFLFEGPVPGTDNVSFLAAFHRNWHDLVLKAIWPDDAPMSLTVAPAYYDYQFKINWNINKDQSLEFFALGSDDRWVMLFGEEEDSGIEFGIRTSFQEFRLKHDWAISNSVSNTFMPYVGHEKENENFFTGMYLALSEVYCGARDDLNLKLSKNYEMNFGIEGGMTRISINLNAPHLSKDGEDWAQGNPTETRGVDDVFNYPYLSGYAELVAKVIDRLKLIPGIRADYYAPIKDYSIDGRFTARYQLFDWTALKAGVGTYHNRPLPAYVIEGYGNPDLDPEWSLQYSAGFEQNLSELLSVEITGFYVDMNDLVASNPELSEAEEGEEAPPPYINGADGRSYGMELMLKHEPSKYFSGWVSYTLSRSERKFPGKEWQLFEYDQTHNLAAVGMVYLPHNFTLGFRFRLVSGIPMEFTTERGGFNSDQGDYIQSFAGVENIRAPLTHTLDVRIDKTFVFDRLLWTLYLDVMNVYNNRNKEFGEYNYDYSEHKYVKGLPILPAIGTQIEF